MHFFPFSFRSTFFSVPRSFFRHVYTAMLIPPLGFGLLYVKHVFLLSLVVLVDSPVVVVVVVVAVVVFTFEPFGLSLVPHSVSISPH